MSLRARFLRELASAALPVGRGPFESFTASQLASLPEPARRYLRFTGVLDRPPDWSFRLGFTGRFRTAPRRSWRKCEAWQYNTRVPPARIFHIRIRFGGLLPVVGRDTWVQGRGRMRIRLLDLFTVEDGRGEEYDIGEMVTWLNDAVMLAPSMLLVPEVTWAPADDSSFDLSFAAHGRTVTARVSVDGTGAPRDFTTTDRFCFNPDTPQQLIRARWNTPMEGWHTIGGRPLPTSGRAEWSLPSGPFPYAEFRLISGSVAFNVAPGA